MPQTGKSTTTPAATARGIRDHTTGAGNSFFEELYRK